MATTLAATVSASALSLPVKDLYEMSKDYLKEGLSKWNNAKNIKGLAKKVSSYEQVQTIWQREKKVRLSSFYYPSKVTFSTGITKTVTSLRDLPLSGGLVLQGTVGQGKTVFLRYLCVQELSEQSSGRIPVFFELRKLDSSLPLEKALFETLQSLGFEVTEDLFEYYAESGKLVVLLDGFDELDESIINAVVRTLETWAVRYPKLQFIITCRPGGEIQKSNHFTTIPLAPLSPGDHKPFLSKIGVKGEVLDNLLAAIEGSPVEIRDLLTTPLLLTLLVLVYQNEGIVPNELPEFFKLLFSTVFSRHDRSKPAFVRKHKSGLNERKLEGLFEAFCYSVIRRKYTVNLKAEQFDLAFSDALRFSRDQCLVDGFKHDITNVACLLQEDGLYLSFVHKSLLDYYPAAFVKNCTDDQVQKIYSMFSSRDWHQWQHVLQFLSLIDTYRFAKYFAIPQIEGVLGMLGVLDQEPTDSKVLGSLDCVFTKETGFSFTYDEDKKIYTQKSFGPFVSIDCFYAGFSLINVVNTHDFFRLESLNSKFTKRMEGGEEVFFVYWKDMLSKQQLVDTRERARTVLSALIQKLNSFREFVAEEMYRADLLIASDVGSPV
jgi:hypothetical protein